jgi:hypothetical protein
MKACLPENRPSVERFGRSPADEPPGKPGFLPFVRDAFDAMSKEKNYLLIGKPLTSAS